jgi:hypothetical protein
MASGDASQLFSASKANRDVSKIEHAKSLPNYTKANQSVQINTPSAFWSQKPKRSNENEGAKESESEQQYQEDEQAAM